MMTCHVDCILPGLPDVACTGRMQVNCCYQFNLGFHSLLAVGVYMNQELLTGVINL